MYQSLLDLAIIEAVRYNTSFESVRFNETQVYSNIPSLFSSIRIYTSSICARHQTYTCAPAYRQTCTNISCCGSVGGRGQEPWPDSLWKYHLGDNPDMGGSGLRRYRLGIC